MKLIVGLGNPGKNYAFTRHNAGFLLLDTMGYHENFSFSQEKKFFGSVAQTIIREEKILLLKPETYMNRSGKSVKAVVDFFKISPEEVLVIHDEIDLPHAKIAYKQGGGHAGHNGLRDIIQQLGSNNFKRIRIGVGRPSHPSMSVADYVLGNFTEQEFQHIIDQYVEYKELIAKFITA